MNVPLQSPNKIRAVMAAVGLIFCFADASAASAVAAENAEHPVPAAVAQSARGAAPIGDARPATIGDVKEVRQEIQNVRLEIQDVRREIQDVRHEIQDVRHEIRELRDSVQISMNTMWATMILGFVAIFAAIIQSGRQARAQNNQNPASRRANKLQTALPAAE